MSGDILVNITPNETRLAIVENGVVQEVYIERQRSRGMVGNIYKGKVSRILPGMQAAFIDIGLERAAFLHVSDISSEMMSDEGEMVQEAIDGLLNEGQELMVQVVKDPLGTKGARLTMHVSIPSRYLVFIPDAKNIGVSQKIEGEAERERLRDLVMSHDTDQAEGGYIIRTAADGVNESSIHEDMEFLHKLWSAIKSRYSEAASGSILHEDLPLAMRALRDLVDSDIERVRIDSRETHKKAIDFSIKFVPEVASRIEYYPGERPIFDLYSVEDEILKALDRKVQLKSGGYLIIDQTEAMTTIDINTGAFVGHRNLEETIFKTNLEATQAIARQLRLRNLGGIIIIDFIDMKEPEHRRQVLRSLEKSLERDHAKCHISDVSSLGLVEMTRKRTRESLEHILCEPCAVCDGRGTLRTAETVCYEIFREILREARQFEAKKYLVLASQDVVDRLLDEESTSVAELEEFIGKPIKFQVETMYTQEQYDVVLM
jgi:ribonuclease G